MNVKWAKIVLCTTIWSIEISVGLKWDKIRCSFDREPVQEGILPKKQFGRYPWLGIIQYDFFYAGHRRYALTAAVRIHPWYALAAAEDVAKIDRKTMTNNTHFIVWHSEDLKYYMGVMDYILHNEYTNNITYATVAMMVLIPDQPNKLGHAGPALPICLPFKAKGTFNDLYVIRISDDTGELRKEVTKMNDVSKEYCTLFYQKAELDYKMMTPVHMLCAVAHKPRAPCVWDGGAILVSRESDMYWTLLGFSTRGPGCGAPSRYVDVNSHMEWIDAQIARASYYQCEDCLYQCCHAVYAPTAEDKRKKGRKLPYI